MRVTMADFARAIGVSRPRISQLKSQGKIDIGTDGLLDLHREAKRIGKDVDETQLPPPPEPREQFLTDQHETEPGGPIDFSYYRSLKMKEEALLAKREREVVDGTLLKRETVVNELGTAFHTCKTRMLSIPTSIAGILATETDAKLCEEIVEGSIREALASIGAAAAVSGAAVPSESAAQTFG